MTRRDVTRPVCIATYVGLCVVVWGCAGMVDGVDGEDAGDGPRLDAAVGDVTPPEVELVSPEPGAVLSEPETVVLEAVASDDTGVLRVDFFDGDTRLGAVASEPYQYEWSITDADNGEHELFARAFDAAGNSAASPVVSLTVDIRGDEMAGTRKWFPGQYSKTEAASGPGFTGWRVNVNWAKLEPHEGQYDFSQIEGSLNRAQAQGKKVILFFQILTYGGQNGTAPAWAAQQGAVYAGQDSQGRTFGVLKVYEPWVTSKLIALWEKLRQRFDSHPALALFTVSEATILPQPRPGFTQEKIRDQWYRWCDHLETWAETPRTLTMTYGASNYKKQMSQYAVDRRIGVRAPDMRNKQQNCAKVPEVCQWSHAWVDYQDEAIYQIMCSRPSSGCLASPQATYNEAVQAGIHFLVWVDAPQNWTAAEQKAFVQSKANLPACGMKAERPPMWPE